MLLVIQLLILLPVQLFSVLTLLFSSSFFEESTTPLSGIISHFELFDVQKTDHGDHPIHHKSSQFSLAKAPDLFLARPSPTTCVRGLSVN